MHVQRVFHLRAWLASAVLLTTSFDGAAQADAPEGEPPAYRATVDEAVTEFGAQNYEEARALFARADALFPNARTQRGLGLVEFELRNYPACIEHLEAALRATVKPLSADLRADAEQLLARARNFVAYIVIDRDPAIASVRVDGLPVELTQENALILQAGAHTLEVQAPGFSAERQSLRLIGGEEKTLRFVLERKSEARAHQATRPWYKSPWLWSGVGVLVIGAATGAGVALARNDDKTPTPYGGSTHAVLSGP